jgi:hypothetical protein
MANPSIRMTQFLIQQIVNAGSLSQTTIVLRDFGCSLLMPSEIDSFSSQSQFFIKPGLSKGVVPTPDGWDILGQTVFPDQLLLGPISDGFVFEDMVSAIASGDAMIPNGVSNPSLVITLYQNAFAITSQGVISTQSIALTSTTVAVAAGSTVPWSMSFTLRTSTQNPFQLSVGVVVQGS